MQKTQILKEMGELGVVGLVALCGRCAGSRRVLRESGVRFPPATRPGVSVALGRTLAKPAKC
jgi:hypothetical protein